MAGDAGVAQTDAITLLAKQLTGSVRESFTMPVSTELTGRALKDLGYLGPLAEGTM